MTGPDAVLDGRGVANVAHPFELLERVLEASGVFVAQGFGEERARRRERLVARRSGRLGERGRRCEEREGGEVHDDGRSPEHPQHFRLRAYGAATPMQSW